MQTLEDVAVLVFLAHELESFLAKHRPEPDKVAGILAKSWAKMSAAGHAAALASTCRRRSSISCIAGSKPGQIRKTERLRRACHRQAGRLHRSVGRRPAWYQARPAGQAVLRRANTGGSHHHGSQTPLRLPIPLSRQGADGPGPLLAASVVTGGLVIAQAFLVARIIDGVLFRGAALAAFDIELGMLVAAILLRFGAVWASEHFGFAAAAR